MESDAKILMNLYEVVLKTKDGGEEETIIVGDNITNVVTKVLHHYDWEENDIEFISINHKDLCII